MMGLDAVDMVNERVRWSVDGVWSHLETFSFLKCSEISHSPPKSTWPDDPYRIVENLPHPRDMKQVTRQHRKCKTSNSYTQSCHAVE